MSKYLASSLILCGFVLGLGFGYYFSPNYLQNQQVMQSMPSLGRADRFVDLRYLNAMASHHKGAILLAEQVKNSSQRQEIVNLAGDILADEPQLILKLENYKKDFYNDSSKTKDPVAVNLGTYDENLDLRFLNALIAHHEDGINMANEIMQKSNKNEILTDASAVKAFLTGSLSVLEQMREKLN
jgi:uncharacterized protein (DUF305 family)